MAITCRAIAENHRRHFSFTSSLKDSHSFTHVFSWWFFVVAWIGWVFFVCFSLQHELSHFGAVEIQLVIHGLESFLYIFFNTFCAG